MTPPTENRHRSLDPAWIAATITVAIAAATALAAVVYWSRARRALRGTGGALITLLGEPACAGCAGGKESSAGAPPQRPPAPH